QRAVDEVEGCLGVVARTAMSGRRSDQQPSVRRQVLAISLDDADADPGSGSTANDAESSFAEFQGGMRVFRIDVAAGLEPLAMIEQDAAVHRSSLVPCFTTDVDQTDCRATAETEKPRRLTAVTTVDAAAPVEARRPLSDACKNQECDDRSHGKAVVIRDLARSDLRGYVTPAAALPCMAFGGAWSLFG
ncbi:MAG: hypothetical protein AAF961_05885, partial [Planctomycetota bacterium]